MVLKLDSRVPMVWRDPFSLQLGIEPSRVVLREVTTAEQRMIHALSAGISRSGLAMIARSSGATERDMDRLLARLSPVLVADPVLVAEPVLPATLPTSMRPSQPQPAQPQPAQMGSSLTRSTQRIPAQRRPSRSPTIAIAGQGRTVEQIASTLAEAGIRVTVSATPSDDPCDLGIAVGHYVLDPVAYGFWLRRDLPHLPVIFGDGDATVGPLVEPGSTPCLYCLEHYRRDVDASWSAIASQLWGRHSSAETPLVSGEVAAMVSRMAVRRLGMSGLEVTSHGDVTRPRPAPGASFRIEAETGSVTRREWMPHPECGCTGTFPGSAIETATATATATGIAAEVATEFATSVRRGADSAADLGQPTRVAAFDERG
jgi:bacteriocin biosynthesis cyclodehydratase domain-containing protein